MSICSRSMIIQTFTFLLQDAFQWDPSQIRIKLCNRQQRLYLLITSWVLTLHVDDARSWTQLQANMACICAACQFGSTFQSVRNQWECSWKEKISNLVRRVSFTWVCSSVSEIAVWIFILYHKIDTSALVGVTTDGGRFVLSKARAGWKVNVGCAFWVRKQTLWNILQIIHVHTALFLRVYGF